jgi:hypothetical protein
MDERKKQIRELEDKKRADIAARGQLLERLGETLFQRIGEGEPFPQASGDTPGGILAEYRKLQKEIADSADSIKGLEADILKLKELEGEIFAKEEEHSRLEKELGEVYIRLGKALLQEPVVDDLAGPLRQQEETLLFRIEEQENKVRELEEREGGVLSWLGKNAQMAVSKALATKNRAALQRVYRSVGEQYIAGGQGSSAWDSLSDAGEAEGLKGRLSSLSAALAGLKKERRNIGDVFSAEGSPSRRIQGLERHIAHTRGKFPAVYLRFGSLAAEAGGRDVLSSVIEEEDGLVLEKAEALKAQIAGDALEIEKIKAAISIDNEKAEIEKVKRAIINQELKIAKANDEISDLEKQIAESERRIEELKAFLEKNK